MRGLIRANLAKLRRAARCSFHGNRPHAASGVIAVGFCDLEGNSSTTGVACKHAQTMQSGCSTGAKEVASRVFNVE
jgi:hypothetical protein